MSITYKIYYLLICLMLAGLVFYQQFQINNLVQWTRILNQDRKLHAEINKVNQELAKRVMANLIEDTKHNRELVLKVVNAKWKLTTYERRLYANP